MNTEDEMQNLLRNATHDLDFAVPEVIGGGTQRGRRLRRRRTAATWVGGMTAAAVVAPLAWVGATALNHPSSDSLAGVASSPATSQTSETPAVSRIPAFDDAGVADELRAILADALPSMTVQEVGNDGHVNRSASRAVAVVADDLGSARVEVQIWPAEEGHVGKASEGLCHGFDARAECSEVDGGTLAVQEASWDNDDNETYYDNIVDFITSDGLRVRAVASNNVGVAIETLAPERAEAPLTVEEVIEIATDPRWIIEGEMPERPAQLPIKGLAFDQVEAARAQLVELVEAEFPNAEILPASTETTGMTLSAAVTVNDGNGVSYVRVSLDPAANDFRYTDFLDGSGPCGTGCTENALGQLLTLALDNDGKAASTGVQNSASLQRADGAYISVSSSNTPVAQHVATSTSRTAPLLSTEQLAAIATSDVWVN